MGGEFEPHKSLNKQTRNTVSERKLEGKPERRRFRIPLVKQFTEDIVMKSCIGSSKEQ